MADNNSGGVELLFTVLGGSSTKIGSGKEIYEALKKIKEEFERNNPLRFSVDVDYFKTKQLPEIVKVLQAGLSKVRLNIGGINGSNGGGNSGGNGVSSDVSNIIKSLKGKYNAEKKLLQKDYLRPLGIKYDNKDLKLKKKDIEEAKSEWEIINIRRKIASSKAKAVGIIPEYKVDKVTKRNLNKEDLEIATKITKEYKKQQEIEKKLSELKNTQKLENQEVAYGKLTAQITKMKDSYKDLYKHSPEAKKIIDELEKKASVNPFERNEKTGKYVNEPNYAENEKYQKTLLKDKLDAEKKLNEIRAKTNTLGNNILKSFESQVSTKIATVFTGAILGALAKIYKNVIDIDKSVTNIQIATGKTREETKKLVLEYSQLAKELGATVTQITYAADTWLRQGYNVAETNQLITNTLYLSKLGQIDSTEAAKALTSAMKGYNVTVAESEKIVDKLVKVDMEAATSAGGIATAMAETAKGAGIAGVSMDKLIGYITTVAEVSQDAPESVGTFFKTLLARMGNVKAGKFIDDESGENLNDTMKVLNSLGISMKDKEGSFRDFGDVLDEVASKWENYDNVTQHAIATALAGTRQQEKLFILLENYKDALKYTEISENSEGTAYLKYTAAYLNSIQGGVASLQAAWQNFSMLVIDSDFLVTSLRIITKIVDVLSFVADFLEGAPMAISAILIATIALFGIVQKIRLSLKGLGIELKSFFTKTPITTAIYIAMAILTVLNDKVSAVTSFIISSILTIGITILALIPKIRKLQAELAPKDWVTLIIAIIALLAQLISSMRKAFIPSFKELKKAAADAAQSVKDAKDRLQEINDELETTKKRIIELNSMPSLTLVEEQELEKLRETQSLLSSEVVVVEAQIENAKRLASQTAIKAIDKFDTVEHNRTFLDWLLVIGNEYNKVMLGVTNSLDEMTPIQEFFDILGNNVLTSDDQDELVDTLTQLKDILSGAEYGVNEELDERFETYYKMVDTYTLKIKGATSATEVWNNIISRSKSKEIVELLTQLANEANNIEELTNSLQSPFEMNDGLLEFVEYLSEIGLISKDNLSPLINQIAALRKGIESLPSEGITDGIEATTDRLNLFSKAIDEVKENGFILLDTYKELIKQEDIFNKYFILSENGITLNSDNKNGTKFDILKGFAIKTLEEYQKTVIETKKALDEVGKNDFDYPQRLNNYAIALDNYNNKFIQTSMMLREFYKDEKLDQLNKRKDQLDEQLAQYKEIIEIRKDLLKSYKEELDYQKELTKKKKNLADIETQLTLAKLDSSASGQARVRELEEELEKAKEDVENTQFERTIELLNRAIDKEQGEYEKVIQQQTKNIEDSIKNISEQLTTIINSIGENGSVQPTSLTNSGEMVELYNNIRNTKGFTPTSADFMDAISRQDFDGASSSYESTKSEYDNFIKNRNLEKENVDEKYIIDDTGGTVERMTKRLGDNGVVLYKDQLYYVENGGAVADMKIREGGAYYKDKSLLKDEQGNLYTKINGDMYLIRARASINELYSPRSLNSLKTQLGIYHQGGFVGDYATLKNNEQFAKLLKGEFVATPRQMDNFIKNTLPRVVNSNDRRGGANVVYNQPLVKIECGTIDKNTMPDLKHLVNMAVSEINKNMESALIRTGYRGSK